MSHALNPFYSPITFSITAEDYLVIEKALRITPGASTLCIVSSGDTPLNLLWFDPDRVDAVDISFPQICLARLKSEGLRQLSLEEFRLLLGVRRNPDPNLVLDFYSRIRSGLPNEVRDFWDCHRYMLKRGVLWQGGLQRLIGFARVVLWLLLGQEGMKVLAQVSNREQAEAFCRQYINNQRFTFLFGLIINRLTYRLFYPKEGFRYLPPEISPYQFSLLKVQEMVLNRPIANNPYLFPILFGYYPSDDCMPPYLNSTYYDKIQARIERLNFIHRDLREHLRTLPRDSISYFTLCNTVDWMSISEVVELLHQVVRVARDGARVLIFSRSKFITVPPSLQTNLLPEPELSMSLRIEDRVGYYQSVNILQVTK